MLGGGGGAGVIMTLGTTDRRPAASSLAREAGRAISRQIFCIPARPPISIIPRNSARLKLVYWTLTLSGKIAAQFTSFSLIDQMNLLLDSCADYYGTPLPCVTIAHITHGTQSVAVLILG